MGGGSSKNFHLAGATGEQPATGSAALMLSFCPSHSLSESLQSPRLPSLAFSTGLLSTTKWNFATANQANEPLPLVQSYDLPPTKHSITAKAFSKSCELEVVRELIGAQVNITLSSPDASFSPLFIACHNGLAELVHRLIQSGSCDIHSPDAHGYTPLYIACYKGYTNIVQLLISHNVDVNVGKPPYSPLYAAAKNGHIDIVNLLIDARANVALCDTDQLLAYDVAAAPEIRQLILRAHETYGKGICVICWEDPVHSSFSFVPCGHNVVCRSCNRKMKVKDIARCPMCRAEIWCRSNYHFD